MKKRIISLVSIIAVLLSLTAVPVNADMIFKDDYAGCLDNEDVITFTESKANGVWLKYDASTTGISFDSETVKIAKTESTSPIYDLKYNPNIGNYVLMFDMKQSESFVVGGYLYASPDRFEAFATNPTANDWYSHLIQLKPVSGGLRAYYYRKLQSASDYEFVKELSRIDSSSENKLRINIAPANNTGKTIWFDNIEVHEGLYAETIKFTTDTAAEITNLSEISAGTTSISANMKFFDADFAAGNISTSRAVLPALIALDKNGRMLDCTMSDLTITPLANAQFAPLTLNISSYVDEIDKVQLLMWDTLESMQPVIDTIELK